MCVTDQGDFEFPDEDCRGGKSKRAIGHKGAEKREKPTGMFIDPNQVDNPFNDKPLLQALELKLKKDPNMVLPEGYKKKIERTPIV